MTPPCLDLTPCLLVRLLVRFSTFSTFDHFTQDTVNLIFSHVNSVKRKVLNGKTPYEMFSFVYGEIIAKVLGISEIPATDVIQSPKLLKKFAKSPPESQPHTDVSMPGQNGGDSSG